MAAKRRKPILSQAIALGIFQSAQYDPGKIFIGCVTHAKMR
jgi:hypothetical protein